LLRMKKNENSTEVSEVAFKAQNEADATEWAVAISNCIGAKFDMGSKGSARGKVRKISLSKKYDKNLVASNPFAKQNYYVPGETSPKNQS